MPSITGLEHIRGVPVSTALARLTTDFTQHSTKDKLLCAVTGEQFVAAAEKCEFSTTPPSSFTSALKQTILVLKQAVVLDRKRVSGDHLTLLSSVLRSTYLKKMLIERKLSR